MEHDEHEMLIEYSEMTSFDFNSKEFQEVRRDYIECKDMVSNLVWSIENFMSNLRHARNY